jgi:uncharacterized phiE125 gp8 family phage protein
MRLRQIVEPEIEPVSLAEVKEHLRIEHDDEDATLAIYIRAARKNIEGPNGFTGRALVTQTWELVLDEFPDAEIRIPLPPLQTVESVKYYDTDGNLQTVSSSDYEVDTVDEPGWISPITTGWPTGLLTGINAVIVRFVAGYPIDEGASPPDAAGNVPEDIKAALLLQIGALYENRENVLVGQAASVLPMGAEWLLRPHRVHLSLA